MPATAHEVIARYLDDAVAAERSVASQLRDLAADGDDDEVRQLLSDAAAQSEKRAEDLEARKDHGGPNALKTIAASLFANVSHTPQIGHLTEERILQNLITGYTMTMSVCGMYRALRAAAAEAGDSAAESFAAEAISSGSSVAGKLFHLIPTRAIIAYNMLTVTEIDLSVETKYGESSWTG